MSSAWLVAGAVTLAGHGMLGAWLAQREPAPRVVKKTVVAFKVVPPPPIEKKIEPPEPPPAPPPPPPPKLVKRVRPRAESPVTPPEGPTNLLDPADSGLPPDQSAPQGGMTVPTGGGIDGPIQKGTGTDRSPAPAEKPKPARKFVPIFEVTRMPRAIRRIEPEVPDEFRSQSREAVVVVEVAISASGRVVDARVIKKAGFGLDEAAIAAARRTSFEPAMQGDRPVAVKMQIPYRFKVRG